MAYRYITDNNLYEKQNYMYSEYGGIDFIKDYIDSRQGYLNAHKDCGKVASFYDLKAAENLVCKELGELCMRLEAEEYSWEITDSINEYIKSFEVRKRLYTGYDSNWKPVEGAGFEDYESYLLFAECLIAMYKYTNGLKYFSCLLKVDDTLLSIQGMLTDRSKRYLCKIVDQELKIFFQLADKNGIYMEAAK